MKANLRTIIGMLGSVVMASCTTTTIDERDITQIPIEFGSSVSRAAVNVATEMSSFSVWGGYDGTNNLFEKTTVTKDGAYEGGTRYWVANKTFNFYAVHPSTLQNIEVSEGNIKVSDFDCSATGNDAIDLMTAVASRTTSNPMNEQDVATVPISFKHELAKVNINIISEGSNVDVSKLYLYGIGYIGNFNSNSSDKWAITNYNGNDEQNQLFNTNPFSLTQNNLEKNPWGDLLLIPCNNLQNAQLHIEYNYQGETKTNIVDLSLKIDSGWQSNNQYKYKVSIPKNSTNVNISVEVHDWDYKDYTVEW